MSGYEVGYKKPPKHTRFKKGVCPNPRGRPRKPSPEAWKLIWGVLAETFAYKDGDVEKFSSLKELAVEGVVRSAASGDARAIKKFLTMLRYTKVADELGPIIIEVTNAPRRRDAAGRPLDHVEDNMPPIKRGHERKPDER